MDYKKGVIIVEEKEINNRHNQLIEDADTQGITVHIFENVGKLIHSDELLLTVIENTDFCINSTERFQLISSNKKLCGDALKYYSRLFYNTVYIDTSGNLHSKESSWNYDNSHLDGNAWNSVTIIKKMCGKYIVDEPYVGECFLMENNSICKIDIKQIEDIVIRYSHMEDILVLFKDIVADGGNGKDVLSIYKSMEELSKNRTKMGEVQFGMFLIALENYFSKLSEEFDYIKVLFLSFLVAMTKNGKYLDEYNRIVNRNQTIFTPYNKYFYWRQQWRMPLRYGSLGHNSKYSEDLFCNIYKYYQEECKDLISPIKKEERNKNRVVVLVIQFLEETHAPTRTALERCATLAKMGKEVFIINTLEQLTLLGLLPVYGMEPGRIFDDYNKLKQYKYDGEVFNYYQPEVKMPEFEETRKILSMIREWNPYEVLTMGTGSIISDLVANIVPVINIPLAFSTIVKKNNQFSALGRKISESEWASLTNQGYLPESIIESTFTFDIKKQFKQLTREQLGLPLNKFLLAIVGLRLDFEIQPDFIAAMSQLFTKNIHLVFAGYFDRYNDMCNQFPELKEHSSYVGFQDDIIAFYNIMDLYINPKRLGGGFSIAEAFSAGKPGVTIAYGDVAAAAGKEFCVNDYTEMQQIILKYITDNEFYNEMVLKGNYRLKELTDSSFALKSILEEAEKRALFF